MKSTIFSAVVGIAALALNAKTLYVDAANYGKSGLDGTEALAYGTIQDAIDAAAKDDTIKVKPGVYDQGGKPLAGYDYTLVHRVMINKKLAIESTDGRDVTHIVGHKDPEGDEDGRGLNAIRCVGVAPAGLGSTMTGFTVRDSACFAGTAKNALTNVAGGALVYAWASRCRVVDCHGVSDATRFAFLSSCLVADCGATALGSTVYTVNCAVPDAAAGGFALPVLLAQPCGHLLRRFAGLG